MWRVAGPRLLPVRCPCAVSVGRYPEALPTWLMSPECPDVDLCTEHTATVLPWPLVLGHTRLPLASWAGPSQGRHWCPPTADHKSGARVRASPSTERRKDSHQRLWQSVHSPEMGAQEVGVGTQAHTLGIRAGQNCSWKAGIPASSLGICSSQAAGPLGSTPTNPRIRLEKRLSLFWAREPPGTSCDTLGTEPRPGPHGVRPSCGLPGSGRSVQPSPQRTRSQRACVLLTKSHGAFRVCSRQMLFFFSVLRLQHKKY